MHMLHQTTFGLTSSRCCSKKLQVLLKKIVSSLQYIYERVIKLLDAKKYENFFPHLQSPLRLRIDYVIDYFERG